MAKKVPISVENVAFERLDLSRHYLTVDCDFTCFLVLNPSGEIPVEGTDICALHTGAWQIDAWSLLTKKDFPNQAGFVACLVWDKTLISDTVHVPACVESDIDTANSVSSLKGQPVNIVGFSMASGDALPVQLPADFQASVASSLDNPVFTRFHPFYFSTIRKDVPLGDGFELLKAAALEVTSMADGGFKFLLRPRHCRLQYQASPPAFCYVNPHYLTALPTSSTEGNILDILENRLLVTVSGESPHVVTNIDYFLTGLSIKTLGSWASFGGFNKENVDFVEF